MNDTTPAVTPPLDAVGVVGSTGALSAIVDLVRAAGAVPVLLGYPVVLRPEREAVQQAIARVAVEAGVLCFDTQPVTAHLMARRVDDLFFPDLHPTERFYRPMAWKLARELVRRGVVPPDAPARAAASAGACVPLVR